MVEVDELMIGDYVEVYDEIYPIIGRVTEIYDCGAEVNLEYKRDDDEMNPIDLTLEIIKENGFEHLLDLKDFYHRKATKDTKSVNLIKFECGWKVEINATHVPGLYQSVHQIQNLLRIFKAGFDIKLKNESV